MRPSDIPQVTGENRRWASVCAWCFALLCWVVVSAMADQQSSSKSEAVSEPSEDAAVTEPVDEELDDLLDSALQDFQKPAPKQGAGEASRKKTRPADGGGDGDAAKSAPLASGEAPMTEGEGDPQHPWTAEFGQFADVMQGLLREEPQLQEQFSRIAQSANRAASASSDEEFAATLNETLRSISDTALAFGDPPTEEELSRLVGSLGLEGGGGGIGSTLNGGDVPGLVSMMQGMMQNLLSKELLYPALRDIVDKYPDWLAEKRSSLPEEEYERYNRQFGLMRRVCEEFESEQAGDATEVKQARFDRVLSLMQKMQECGHPPKDLVEISPDLGLDEQGNPRIPGLPDQCAIM